MMIRTVDQAQGLRAPAQSSPDSKVERLRSPFPNLRSIAVTSGKGGVGKTQIAANLAVGLARLGQRVILLDADLGLASLDLALGVSPRWDLRSFLTGEKSIEDVLVEGPCGVQLLPACPGRYDMANMETKERTALTEAIQKISDGFDVLVIDTGAGIGSNAVSFSATAEEILLVTTPDPTALRDAYAMAKVLHRRSGVNRINLVANQVSSETEGLYLHERLRDIVDRFLTLDLVYLGAIPRDTSVRESVVSGEPYILRAPASPASRATTMLAERIHRPASRIVC